MKPILISGIQPSGKLHIGNYFGALKNFVDLQNSGRYQCYFFVADLHSITEDFDPNKKYQQIREVILNYLAAGIKPEKSVLFIQSQVLEHAELAWILNTITPIGELSRMTQFKEKGGKALLSPSGGGLLSPGISPNVGLFDYPVLQAADILLYDAEVVPVGEDQIQHLEFTRTLARKFNQKFLPTGRQAKKIFIEPKELLTETPRIMSLNNPLKKMSKSIPEGCLFLDDTADTIREKLKRAVTDSGTEIKYDPENKPAVSNLIRIYRAFSGMTIKEIEIKFQSSTYSQFKKDLAESTVLYLKPFQVKKKLLAKKPKEIEKIIEKGRKTAQKKAADKMTAVKKVIGLEKK